jgi:hypothetical protein
MADGARVVAASVVSLSTLFVYYYGSLDVESAAEPL